MSGQDAAVEPRPLQDVVLLRIVGNKGDPLAVMSDLFHTSTIPVGDEREVCAVLPMDRTVCEVHHRTSQATPLRLGSSAGVTCK